MLRRRIFHKPIATECHFCVTKTVPDYKEVEVLKRFVTDRGKIVGRSRSGMCQRHQRRFAVVVKQARHLALMSYTGR